MDSTLRSSMGVIHRDVKSPSSESVFSMFILRDDTSSQVPDHGFGSMVKSKQPAFLAVHGGNTQPLSSARASVTPFSQGSVKLPYLDTSQQLLTSSRPSISQILSPPSSSSSARKHTPSHNRPSWDKEDVLDHLNQRKYLKDELEDKFGFDAPTKARQQYGVPSDSRDSTQPQLIDQLMASRNREHTQKRDDHLRKLEKLNQERLRLMKEQDKLQEKHRHLMAMSPAFSYAGRSDTSDPDWSSYDRKLPEIRPETAQDVTASGSFIRDTERNLPAQMAKYQRMREQHLADVERMKRPYNGELGPQSYEAWQMEDYDVVRGVVEEVVDQFLDTCFRPEPTSGTEHAAIEAEKREWERRKRALDESQAVQLVMEELLLEETRDLAREVAEEFIDLRDYILNKTNEMNMQKVEEVAMDNTEGRDPRDAAYNLVTKGFHAHVSDRNTYRPQVWGHRQHLHLRGRERDSDDESEEEEDDESVELLHFHDIIPLDLRQIEPRAGESYKQRQKKEKFLRYMRREVLYWKSMSISIQDFKMSSKCLGAYTVQVSPNHRFMAVGTAHGDILVIDLLKDPLVPLRAIHNASQAHDAVMDIAWSLNSTQILTINQTGVLQLWSMNSGGILKADNKGLNLKADKSGVLPEQLSQNLIMDADEEDFTFQTGPLAENQVMKEAQAPVKAVFYPSLTLMGTQNVLSVALENGDILRCDVDQRLYGAEAGGPDPDQPYQGGATVLHPMIDNGAQMNLVGQNIPAELFRRHKRPIVFMGFVRHIGDMVTVDQRGYINRWKYSSKLLASENLPTSKKLRKELANYDWYVPTKTLRLDMSKTMYTPISNTKPNIVFTDRLKGSRHKRTRQQIHRDRMKVDKEIGELDLGDPWHQDILPEQLLITQVFAPREKIPESGSIFHVILRHAVTDHLSTYLTRVYKPVKVPSTKFLCCTQTPDGSALIFLLLFPEFPPKEAHISVVILELDTMQLKNWRRDIDIEDDELYEELLENDRVSCSVSKVCGTTGSPYLFVNIAGHLSVYSLNTGLKVLRTEDPSSPQEDGFDGCRLSTKGFWMAPSAQLCVAGIASRIFLMAYTAEQSSKSIHNPDVIHLMEINDDNEEEERVMMRKSYQMWKPSQPLPPSEMRVDVESNETGDIVPVEVLAKSVIMELVDDIIQGKTRGYTTEQVDMYAEHDRVQHYADLMPQWNAGRSTVPPMTRQSSYRAPPTRAESGLSVGLGPSPSGRGSKASYTGSRAASRKPSGR